MSELKVAIVTPARKMFEQQVKALNVPTSLGYIGILPNHTSLIAVLEPGCVTITGVAESSQVFVKSGFMDVRDNQVNLYVDEALWPRDIDRDQTKKAVEDAGVRVSQSQSESEVTESLRDQKVALEKNRIVNQLRN